MKKRAMTVEPRRPYDWNTSEGDLWVYHVNEVDNAITPTLGTVLTPDQLSPYCEDESWTVRIRWPK